MSSLQFRTDRAGFPMVVIDTLDIAIHWLPLTKIQFEWFICSQTSETFDEAWYNEVTSRNPRISPSRVSSGNYWQAFLTDIRPSEAERFARWCGDSYSLPTLDQWLGAYEFLKTQQPVKGLIGTLEQQGLKLSERAKTLLEKLDAASEKGCKEAGYPRTLADQMFLRRGVLEWVAVRDARTQWGGMGLVNRNLHSIMINPDNGQPARPGQPELIRMHYYGFRLIRSGLS
ncbi:MAG: hypothetical protein OHK0022_30060 [Roseiflexaceae bacterium]